MSWRDQFAPKLVELVDQVDAQIAPRLAAIDEQIIENQARCCGVSGNTTSLKAT